jgi:2-polyprenyl-3-methyl-5-hydroxy-6-metoxy-1,4-benzoquinol methylase
VDALRYTREIDLDDTNNAHSLGVLAVAPGSRVLDVGCAAGHVGRVLRERGCVLWGVEIDADAAALAADAYERVVVGDVDELDLTSELAGLEFDVVLMLDVLEHLKQPERALRQVRPLLPPGGKVIASIPNVTHAALRLELLGGRFRYRETGLLDRTHLRFFDRHGVEELFKDGGFAVDEMLRVTRQLDETEFAVNFDELPAEALAVATADEDATTYQFLAVATPRDPVPAAPPVRAASLAERLQAERDALKQQVAEGARYVESLEAQHGEQLRHIELERELLYNDLMVKEAYIAELRSHLEAVHTQPEQTSCRDRSLRLVIRFARHVPFARRGARWLLATAEAARQRQG